jgi:hypothetical protein
MPLEKFNGLTASYIQLTQITQQWWWLLYNTFPTFHICSYKMQTAEFLRGLFCILMADCQWSVFWPWALHLFIYFLKKLQNKFQIIGERIVISIYFQVYYFQFPHVLPVTSTIKWSQKMKNRDGNSLQRTHCVWFSSSLVFCGCFRSDGKQRAEKACMSCIYQEDRTALNVK